jgi:aromatic ring-cleaving dioxygenase
MHSYHIHVLFWTASKERVASALTLHREFIERFGLEGKDCDINPGDPGPGHEMCCYEVRLKAQPPFTTAEYSFFIPYKDLQRTSEWILQRKGDHDIFIHPNTGCEWHDHLLWSSWSGDKWPLDTSMFTCNYPGCIPGKHLNE